MEIKPVAYIYTDFEDKFGLPRQSGRVAELFGEIVFEPEYRNSEAIRGIEDFSHLWIIFGFSKAERDKNSLTVRPPRLGGNKRVGVFATRSPYRPNSMGLSCVKLEGIKKDEKNGDVLLVSGIDMLSGTPIYDIKPYIPYADSKPYAKGSFAEEQKGHFLNVDFPEKLLKLIPENKQKALISCLSDDPRPSYHTDERIYSMKYCGFDVHFRVQDDILTVNGIDLPKK